MRVLAELIGSIFLLAMFGLGVKTFFESWKMKQVPEPVQTIEKDKAS